MLLKILFFTTLIGLIYADDFFYPCLLSDSKCMTNYLAANSNCEPRVWGSVPKAITFYDVETQVPYANATFTEKTATWMNLDQCEVSAFFVNETTSVLILAVDCPNLVVVLNRTITQHYQYGLDRQFKVGLVGTLPPIIFTANLQNTNDISLCNQFVYTYLEGVPKYKVIPYNQATAAYLRRGAAGATLPSHLSGVVREEFVNVGATFFRIFIDFLLCDFNCEYDFDQH